MQAGTRIRAGTIGVGSVTSMEFSAPIVAVTVYPRRARVTREGVAEIPAGTSELVLAGLPATLLEESVRVSGRSSGAVRVRGVDVRHRDLVEVPDERVRAAEAAVREATRALAAIDGEDAADAARQEMVLRLARRSGDRLAAALADGRAGPERVGEVASVVAGHLVDVAASRRVHAERRELAGHALAAAQAELDRLRGSGRRRRDAVLTVEADGPAEVAIELDYLVSGAGWSTTYDARLVPENDRAATRDAIGRLELTWFGVVTQTTGEDWPECRLTLSTARPTVTAALPELDPWWVEEARQPVPLAAAAPVGVQRSRAVAEFAQDVQAEVAQPVEGVLAGAWQLAAPTAVHADGTPHRTTVASHLLPARLDHVTAPALDLQVYLRATATNDTGQVLLAGPVSTFADGDLVGSTTLGQTPPDAEFELAFGVDDRVLVERELVERVAHRSRLGAAHGGVERWEIRVENRRSTPARVQVRDRIPVSRTATVKVIEVALSPQPVERDELGRVEWVAVIPPGGSWQAGVRFGVEHPKHTTVTGWR